MTYTLSVIAGGDEVSGTYTRSRVEALPCHRKDLSLARSELYGTARFHLLLRGEVGCGGGSCAIQACGFCEFGVVDLEKPFLSATVANARQ